MADSSVPISAGTGTNIDTFTQASGDHRQAVVIGDAAAAQTLAVDASGRITVNQAGTVTTDVNDRAARLLGVVTNGAGTATIGAVTGPGAAALALDGTDITTPTAMPAGGVGIRGWLSAIWTKLNGSIAVTGTFFQATQPVSLATNTPDVTDRAARLLGVISTGANTVGAVTAPGAAALALDATLTGGTQKTALVASTLIVSTTGAAAAAVTCMLPAAGAGLFHYITRVNILKYASVAVVGGAAPIVVTSTNLAGSLAWSTPTAQAVGTQYETDLQPAGPIKSSVANTATTIVCPATTSIIWRVNVYYYVA